MQRIAREGRRREADVEVREVRDRLLGDVVDAEREAEVQEEERVERPVAKADLARVAELA